jgi:hypothetical protein
MNKLSFKRWAFLKEWADFGFEKKMSDLKAAELGGTVPHEGDGLIDPIDSELITDELRRLPPLGYFSCRYKMSNLLEWGYDVGALQVFISPLGSYKSVIRRKIRDLQGEETWVCKKVIDFNENEHNKNEVPLAHQIYDCLNELHKEEFDSPKSEYKEFDKLAHALFNEVKRNYPAYCMFPVGMKKMDEGYYKIVYEYRGHGAETPTRLRAEQFNIDLFWDKKKGLIKCWGYEVDSHMRQHNWMVQPSEFEEWYAPTQEIKKIVHSIKIMLMTY